MFEGIYGFMLLVTAVVFLPILLLAWMDCALFVPKGRGRRSLRWTGLVCGGAGLALLAGGGLSGGPELVWRNLPAGVLSAAVLLCGSACALCTAECTISREMAGVGAGLRRLMKGTVAAGALLAVFYALTMGSFLALFAFQGEERVLEYRGETLVEVDDSFLDPIYRYYEYHGPLLRGKECLYTRWERLESDGA